MYYEATIEVSNGYTCTCCREVESHVEVFSSRKALLHEIAKAKASRYHSVTLAYLISPLDDGREIREEFELTDEDEKYIAEKVKEAAKN